MAAVVSESPVELSDAVEERDSPEPAEKITNGAIANAKTKENSAKKQDSDEEGEASDEGEIEEENKQTEKEEGELEEGEVDDDDEANGQNSKNTVCKYFYKGQCTWGSHCRFMHPGSVDKGNYNMFETTPKPQQTESSTPKPSGTSSGTLLVPQPQARNATQRNRSPQLGPPLVPLRLPLPIPSGPLGDFFPPIPEPPRRESAWERSQRTAKNLAQTAARKRDALEDKMHGLNEKFDPDDERFGSENQFPFNEQQRMFPPFGRMDFEQMQRDRRLNNLEFNRFANRRSPPSDARSNLSDRRDNIRRGPPIQSPRQRERAADDWQDPWMRSRSPGRNRRWNRRSKSDSISKSRSRSRSASRHSNRKSHTSRSMSKEKVTRRKSTSDSGSPSPQRKLRHNNNRQKHSPSGSPISSSHSSRSRSRSPQLSKNLLKQKSHTASTPKSEDRSRHSYGSRHTPPPERNSRKEDLEEKGSPSLSSVSSGDGGNGNGAHEIEDEGPHTPPPDHEDMDNSDAGSEHRSPFETHRDNQRNTRSRSKRSPSQSPVSDDDNRSAKRFSDSDNNDSSVQPNKKRFKKGHKPIKMTLNSKMEKRAANAAFGPLEDDEDADAGITTEAPTKSRRQDSTSDREQEDRSSPVSEAEEERSFSSKPVAPASEEKQSKREELLRQLRAVEEAIARKKAVKASD